MPDDRLNGLSAFEQPALFICQVLVVASVLDLNGRVAFVHAPIAQARVDHLRPHAQALHQDRALLDLFIQCVTIVRIVGKAPGTHDQVALDKRGQPQSRPDR